MESARHDAGSTAGRHRGKGHDPMGSVLTGTWVLGNILALFLLCATATQHVGLGDLALRPWLTCRRRARKRPAEEPSADHLAIRSQAPPGPRNSLREVAPPWRGSPLRAQQIPNGDERTMEDRSQLDTEPTEEVVPLEDAALLTKGNTSSSVENKRSPYGA